jgi:hypothetical protein
MNKANLDYLVEKGSIIELGMYCAVGQKLSKLWTQLDEQVKKGNIGPGCRFWTFCGSRCRPLCKEITSSIDRLQGAA